MYELIVKIMNEKDYKKYTIEELEEMIAILENVKTEEVRLKEIEDNRHSKCYKMGKQIWGWI